MIQTILSSPEHEQAARNMNIYGHLLHYVQVVQAGGAAPLLPGESKKVHGGGHSQGHGHGQSQAVQAHTSNSVKVANASQAGNDRAVNYFSACLRILGLEEEVALTAEALKGAYKKAVIRAHPDKGGSEKEFEAVTRAYAYLGEILRRIHGGRAVEGKVEAPSVLASGRGAESDKWKMVEPVSLNSKNLDVNAFNKMFEQTRIPDPEEAGYGDWLKGGDDQTNTPKFGGKFNREVFERAFQEEQMKKSKGRSQNAIVAQEMSLSSRIGATELGRSGRDDYTVAANDPGLKYTDLKKAYTEYNTFSHEVSGVQVEKRNLEDYRSSREKAPQPFADHEMQSLRASEAAALRAEEQRKLRMAQEAAEEDSYFERMKRLVIRN